MSSSSIPNLLWFTYRHDLLATPAVGFSRSDELLAANLRQTARVHQGSSARCLDDRSCMEMIAAAEREVGVTAGPRRHPNHPNNDSLLVRAFRRERDGSFRGDTCRAAALFLHGGVYLDVDIGARLDLRSELRPNATFATALAISNDWLFNAVIAATPRHRVLRAWIHGLTRFYSGRLEGPTGWSSVGGLGAPPPASPPSSSAGSLAGEAGILRAMGRRWAAMSAAVPGGMPGEGDSAARSVRRCRYPGDMLYSALAEVANATNSRDELARYQLLEEVKLGSPRAKLLLRERVDPQRGRGTHCNMLVASRESGRALLFSKVEAFCAPLKPVKVGALAGGGGAAATSSRAQAAASNRTRHGLADVGGTRSATISSTSSSSTSSSTAGTVRELAAEYKAKRQRIH
jgi:hypothetical protein